MPYCKTKNHEKLQKRCKTPSSYRVDSQMKLKPQKERQVLILEYDYIT